MKRTRNKDTELLRRNGLGKKSVESVHEAGRESVVWSITKYILSRGGSSSNSSKIPTPMTIAVARDHVII